MKRSVISRIGVVVVGALLLAVSAACTSPTPPKISAAITQPLFNSPAGILAGQDADFTYRASGLPAGAKIFLQKASISGTSIHWSNVSPLNVKALATGTIIRPPSGRNTYRLGVFDAHGKGLTSAALPLDVFKPITFADLTSREVQTVHYGQNMANSFDYVFQNVIDVQDTSCRAIGSFQVFNSGFRARSIQFSQIIGGKTTSAILPIAGNNFELNGPETVLGGGRLLTLHSEWILQVLNNDTLGSTIYGGNGGAVCLTDTGSF